MPEFDPETKTSRPWTSESVRWIIVTLLIPFAGFVWNEVQKQEAERQKAIEVVRAEQQERVANARSESDVVIQLLPALASPDDTSPMRGIALAILLNLASRQALSPELVSAIQVAVDTTQQRVRAGTATNAEVIALNKIAAEIDSPRTVPDGQQAATGEARPSPATAARAFRVQVPRVYLHIFDEKDRRTANALERWITNEQHWLAPGIENVVATAARSNRRAPAGKNSGDVRYFNEEDRSRAEDIATWLIKNGTPSAVSYITNIKAPPGQIEVWFPAR